MMFKKQNNIKYDTKKFNNGNYILGNLSIHGQHFKIELIINGKREHSNNI